MSNVFEKLFEELKKELAQEIDTKLTEFENNIQTTQPQEEEILKPSEAEKLLKVSPPTLRKYAEKEYFFKYEIDGSPRYLKSEIIEALKAGRIRGKGLSDLA